VAFVSVLVWATILPLTQPGQRLRFRAETALRAGRIAEALAEMSAHAQRDYPPHWDPPPRPAYGEDDPPLGKIFRAVLRPEVQPWVRAIYFDKYVHQGDGLKYPRNAREAADLLETLELIRRLPDGPELLRPSQEYFAAMQREIEEQHLLPATAPASQPAASRPVSAATP
jgi:hypothetical protein